jgi:hypothetical protein
MIASLTIAGSLTSSTGFLFVQHRPPVAKVKSKAVREYVQLQPAERKGDSLSQIESIVESDGSCIDDGYFGLRGSSW